MNIKEKTDTERKRRRNKAINIEISKITKADLQQETQLTVTYVRITANLKTRLKFGKYKLFK